MRFSFLLTYLQSLLQTYASERVARDLRRRLAAKLATQTYSFVEQITPARLLTNLTSDVDGVKQFVSMAIATIISSLFLIAGLQRPLLSIDWRLGLCVWASCRSSVPSSSWRSNESASYSRRARRPSTG